MEPRGSKPGRGLAAAIAAVSLVSACAWNAWIPGESRWNPDVVVDPAKLSQPLALDAPYVGKLDCYARRCRKRFRLVTDRPGQLTVRIVPELSGQDAQARIVLEAPQGPLGQDGSGRGPRTDVPVLAVSETVGSGTYFVLIQSLGGPMPYQLTAHLTPGEGPPPPPGGEATARPTPSPPEGSPRRLTEVSLSGEAGAAFDPAVPFSDLRTFTFQAPRATADPGRKYAPLEQPIDRQIRRYLAEDLTRKGLRQATGDEPADLVVAFSRGTTTRTAPEVFTLYDRYDFGTFSGRHGAGGDTRGTLTVDLVEKRNNRIAWHAWTTKGLGSGIMPGEKSTALVREAVTDVLAAFPPR